MKITKAEILWTRVCHLRCSYCGMADGRTNSIAVDEWKRGIDALKRLQCQFIAFYGAEPLEDFEKLPEVVGYAESTGIHTTVITSGVVKNLFDKLKLLHKEGAKSITMSYDMEGNDPSSAVKTTQALQGLQFFKSLGKIRDVAVVVTLTKRNFMKLPKTIREMSAQEIWTFFDVIHGDRKQPGSKCKGELSSAFALDKSCFEELQHVLREIIALKKQGFLCHTSEPFVNLISKNNFDILQNYSWSCAKEKDFPAWLTVDCDGLVYPCDDFQVRDGEKFYLPDIVDQWERFCQYWKPLTLERCPGCCWNTHIDAHLVKRGELEISDYIHGIKT